jgi:muramoyltetrapeptide carboxypeptidase LdcA involved in peptidoglycan recycling
MPVPERLESSMTQLVSAKRMSCISSIVVGRFVPVTVKTYELVSNENPVIVASGSM